MSDDAMRKAVDAAIRPTVASLGAWGVEEGHWRPDGDGEPVIWLRTQTEIQRVALEAQVWLLPQVQIILTRLSVPYSSVAQIRVQVTSAEGEARLFGE